MLTKWSPIRVSSELARRRGAPNRAQSEKAENALACRIALQDTFATGVLFATVAAICVLPFSLIAYIVASGAGKLFDVSFLTGKPEQFKEGGGIGPELFNSFYLLVLTLLISAPIALGGAICLTEYAPKNRLTHFVKTAIDALSSLPSIVVGLFGFLFFVLQMGWGFSILSGALALTMLNLPILVRVIQQALEAIPNDQREGGLALGASRWETTIHVLPPRGVARYYHGHHFVGGTCVWRSRGPHLYSGAVGADARFYEPRFFERFVSVECVPPGGNACGAHLEDQQRRCGARLGRGFERCCCGSYGVYSGAQPACSIRWSPGEQEYTLSCKKCCEVRSLFGQGGIQQKSVTPRPGIL